MIQDPMQPPGTRRQFDNAVSNMQIGNGISWTDAPKTSEVETEGDNFETFARKLVDDCLNIMVGKSHDYAKDSDRYSNFRSAAITANTTPEQAILTLIGIKSARLCELTTSGKKAKNEAVEDTIQDLINYTIILAGFLNNKQ